MKENYSRIVKEIKLELKTKAFWFYFLSMFLLATLLWLKFESKTVNVSVFFLLFAVQLAFSIINYKDCFNWFYSLLFLAGAIAYAAFSVNETSIAINLFIAIFFFIFIFMIVVYSVGLWKTKNKILKILLKH